MSDKWYRKGLVKGVLVALAHVLTVLLVISMLWILACPSAAESVLENETVSYEEAQGFSDQIFWDSSDILSGISAQKHLETDGVYDEDKIVDVKTYNETLDIDGENTSGLAYRLGDLAAWEQAYFDGSIRSGDFGETPDDAIIVCRKPDRTYEYFFYSEFKQKIDDGELKFVLESEGTTAYDILQCLEEGDWYENNGNVMTTVLDAENQIRYVDCWNYDGYWIEETCAPLGAESVLEVANTNPEWNGKLSEAYNTIAGVLQLLADERSVYDNVRSIYTEGNTNVTYLYVDQEARKVYTNREEYEDYDAAGENIQDLISSGGKYVMVTPKLADFESNIRDVSASDWYHLVQKAGPAGDYAFAALVDTSYPVQDVYYYENGMYRQVSDKIGVMMAAGMISAVLLLVIIVWLTVVAGRRPEDEDLHLHPFDRWKTEIGAGLVIGIWVLCLLCAGGMYDYSTRFGWYSVHSGYYSVSSLDAVAVAVYGLIGFFTCMAFLAGYLSLVRRIKGHSLWKNSLLRWFLMKCKRFLVRLPIVWKHVLGLLLYMFSQFMLWTSGVFILVLAGLAADVAVFIYVVHQAVGKKKIREGIMHIAGGEVNYKIPLEELKGDQREIAERINSIGEGLDAALEASMKNERLKTDLITNVSHDIKTPLTSIINYIDLLKRENIQDEKIQGYLKILEAKAQRLKTLTEDVVEASKVSSGNITLECMNLNLVEMVQQTSGEFAEKFEKRGLQEILSMPGEPAVIWADGRRMWRVLENIYNNAAKYAMEGTRVYADLTQTEDQVTFILKNISQQPLNISADELTERFIRGDVSRSTEGSGLGLSIARNLTELMGGKFELYLDGDLFRVTIRFSRVTPEE